MKLVTLYFVATLIQFYCFSLTHKKPHLSVLLICNLHESLSHTFHSALFTETPMDYGETMTLWMFKACETRQCINVTIEDDNVSELTEFFSGNLLRTDGLDERITLHPNTTSIEITDNDGILIRLISINILHNYVYVIALECLW